MSCKTFVSEGIFFVRWDQPTLADAHRVQRELRAARQAAGKQLIFVAVLDGNTKLPDEEVRQFLAKGNHAILDMCDSMHMVIEGTGFRVVALRSVAAGILLATGVRNRVFWQSTLAETMAAIAKVRPDIDMPTLQAQLAGQGISR